MGGVARLPRYVTTARARCAETGGRGVARGSRDGAAEWRGLNVSWQGGRMLRLVRRSCRQPRPSLLYLLYRPALHAPEGLEHSRQAPHTWCTTPTPYCRDLIVAAMTSRARTFLCPVGLLQYHRCFKANLPSTTKRTVSAKCQRSALQSSSYISYRLHVSIIPFKALVPGARRTSACPQHVLVACMPRMCAAPAPPYLPIWHTHVHPESLTLHTTPATLEQRAPPPPRCRGPEKTEAPQKLPGPRELTAGPSRPPSWEPGPAATAAGQPGGSWGTSRCGPTMGRRRRRGRRGCSRGRRAGRRRERGRTGRRCSCGVCVGGGVGEWGGDTGSRGG